MAFTRASDLGLAPLSLRSLPGRLAGRPAQEATSSLVANQERPPISDPLAPADLGECLMRRAERAAGEDPFSIPAVNSCRRVRGRSSSPARSAIARRNVGFG